MKNPPPYETPTGWPGSLVPYYALVPELPDGDMEWEKTRAMDIYRRLKSDGFDVYFPGQHIGACHKEYVVVKQGDAARKGNLSTQVVYYDILCYIPRDFPANVPLYVEQVKESMKKLWPMITPTYDETAPFFDNEVGAYMASVMYRNYKYIEGGR